MALTKESTADHHHTLVLGIIFIFIRISSQQDTAISSMPPLLHSIAITPSTIVQDNSTNSEIKDGITSSAITTKIINTVTVTEIPKSVVVTASSDSSNNSCSEFKKLHNEFQPRFTDSARLKKCCALNEMYVPIPGERDKCGIANVTFEPVIVEAVFYEHCIEDTEKVISLENKYGNPCGDHEALKYSLESEDHLYVLQNGSLLIVYENFSGYDVFDEYCLDMDRDNKYLTAIVCNQSYVSQASTAQSYLYAICEYNTNPSQPQFGRFR